MTDVEELLATGMDHDEVVAHLDPTGGESTWERTDLEGAVTRVIHRWRHPSFDIGDHRCRCVDEARRAVSLWIGEGRP